MKVWVTYYMSTYCDDRGIGGIFDSEEKAKNYIKDKNDEEEEWGYYEQEVE